MPIRKRKTVTRTKGDMYTKSTKSVVVRGKDGTVKKTKDVYYSPKSYGPTLVTKSKKNKDGTITTKNIERSGIKRKVTDKTTDSPIKTKKQLPTGSIIIKGRDIPLPPTSDKMFK
jgi:hypothetical protein